MARRIASTNRFSARAPGTVRAQFFQRTGPGVVECRLCPQGCRLVDGQMGACLSRVCHSEEMIFTRYGKTSGVCIDPVEKKPLFHFLPGSSTLSFGTAGCNLKCRFCQNFHMSQTDRQDFTFSSPASIAAAAKSNQCESVAMTYNDPVVFFEYALDVAEVCRCQGIHTIAVTAGYLSDAARPAFFNLFDAANVDLKAFSERFYRELCGAKLAPVLRTLAYLREKTSVWLEITTLLIPEENDSDSELNELTQWIANHLGRETPLHFSAFHPDFKLLDHEKTSHATLRRARGIATSNGLHHVYLGNLPDPEGGITYCAQCQLPLIRRDRWALLQNELDHGHCPRCKTRLVGYFRDAGTPANY